MYKSIFDIFTEKQYDLLKNKMWWVADPDKPFLCKFASDGDSALIDLRSLWVARVLNKTLEEDKAKYAKSLQITQKKGLMNIFESLLTATDPDPQTVYRFQQVQPSQLHFTFEKRIKFFDFKWTFKLKKVNCNPVQLICRQLLNPLFSAIQAQNNRLQHLKKHFERVQKDYHHKMTQMQRSMYRSPLLQDKQQWSKLIPPYSQKLLTMYKPDDFSQYCFSNHFQLKPQVKQEPIQLLSGLKIKSSHKPSHEQDHFEFADDYFAQELQLQKSKQKKAKKIDFI